MPKYVFILGDASCVETKKSIYEASYYFEMEAEQRDVWVAALRSNTYPQTREWLYHDGGFCCLGVFGTSVLGYTPEQLNDDSIALTRCYDISPSRRDVPASVRLGTFPRLNDDLRLTFNQIADLVESAEEVES